MARGPREPSGFRSAPVVDVWTGVQGNGPAVTTHHAALKTDARSLAGGMPEATACALTFLTSKDGRREMLRSDAALRAEVRTFVRRVTAKVAVRERSAAKGKHPRGSRNPEVVKSERAWSSIGDATGVFTEK